jgi:hypothetical protein
MRLIGLAVVLVSLVLAPIAAEAQQSTKVPRIGLLGGGSASTNAARTDAFRQRGRFLRSTTQRMGSGTPRGRALRCREDVGAIRGIQPSIPISVTSRRVLDQRGQLLMAALGFAGLPRPSYDRALWALRSWLDSWAGIGHVSGRGPIVASNGATARLRTRIATE